MLNLETLAARETDTFQLRSADDELLFSGTDEKGEPKPVTVTVYGPGSKRHQEVTTRNLNRMTDRLKKRGKNHQTPEEKIREGAEYLAGITERFDNLDYKGLQGRELALAIYSEPLLGFISEQIHRHIGEWANFTKPQQTS